MKKWHWLFLMVPFLGLVLLVARCARFSTPPAASRVEPARVGHSLFDVVSALQAYGLTPTMANRTRYGTEAGEALLANAWQPLAWQDVVVTLPGSKSEGRVLVYAQFQETAAPGTGLGGTASAALLQLIGALQNGPRLQNDVTFHFSTAPRESSLAGETFREQFLADPAHDVLLEIEHRDHGGEVLLFFASKHHYHLVEQYAQRAPPAGTRRPGAPQVKASALAFVEYLGNQPLRRAHGLATRGAPFLRAAQTGADHPGLHALDAAVQAFLRKWNIPGGAVALTKDGRLVHNRGFGYAHRQSHTLVEPTHQFRIASLSKPITAAAVLLLLEQGRLRLDSRVFGTGGILSDTSYGEIIDPRVKDITVRHLLEHSAGWDRDVSQDVMFDPVKIARIMRVHPPADNKSIIRYALSQPLDFAPSARYAYSNVGYAVLGRVIEQLTGQPYEVYVRDHLLCPLGIRSMRIGNTLPNDSPNDEVEYYSSLSRSMGPSIFSSNIWVPWAYGGFYLEAMDAHGGWIASAADLVRFAVAVDGFATKPDVLSPGTLRLMTTPTPALNSGYGLGWWVNAENSWCHTGALPGSASLLERTQDGYTWAILLNRRSLHPDFFKELNNLVRAQVKLVREWPADDLFALPAAQTEVATAEPDTSFHTPLLADTTARR